MPNISQPATRIIPQAKIQTKEDSMMKEEIKEMEKPIPVLQHVHQAKEMSLAMMVPVLGSINPKKYNVEIGEKDVPLSSCFKAKKKEKKKKEKKPQSQELV